MIKLTQIVELYVHTLDPLLLTLEPGMALKFKSPPLVYDPELRPNNVEVHRVRLLERIPQSIAVSVIKVI